jgi:hypothetical protein
MTIEQMMVQYLYNNKKLSLQNIGAFNLTTDIVIPIDQDSNVVLPENAIEFEYNPHAEADLGLVDYIVANTKKIKSLAFSDLESYTTLNKQFLNIGKPYSIEGLGVLNKTQNGKYAFEQASESQTITKENVKTEKVKPVEKVKDKIDFSAPKKEKQNSNVAKMAILGLIGVILLGALSFGGYYLYKNYESNKIETENATIAKQKEETKAKIDSVSLATQTAKKDTNNFYIVIKEFQNAAIAKKRLDILLSYGNNVVLTTKDSVTYKISMPFKTALTDTLRSKDSLAKFFKAKTYVELP